jgi:hypothetical protein
MEAPNNDWILKSIQIDFKQGYSFNDTEDRYEGWIQFQNGEKEELKFKIRKDQTQPLIDIMAEEIVRTATILGDRLQSSMGLSPDTKDLNKSDFIA